MLQVHGLTKTFSKQVTAVDGVCATFLDKRFYGIMGRSGSGKSTLLQMLGTLTVPTAGTISFDGRALYPCKPNALADFRRDNIGFVFQNFRLHPYLTAEENVMLPMQFRPAIPKAERRARAEALLDRVSMGHRGKHYPKELSGGEQQRVAIARALANDPAYLLADEPTGNLDAQNEEKIFALLKALSQDKTVIAVTHNAAVAQYADHVLLMQDGALTERGAYESL